MRMMCLCMLVALFAPAGANLLSNGDFSDWDSLTGPTDWTVEYAPAALVEQHGDTVRSAPYSARITRLVAGTGDNNGVKQYVPVTPGEAYTISAWCYDDDINAGCGVGITWRTPDSSYIINSGTSFGDSSIHTWQRLTKTDTAPAGAGFADVKLRVYGFTSSPAGGVIYYDDAELVQGAGAVTESPTTALVERFTVSPNPTSGRTRLSFAAPRPGRYRVDVYDLTGSPRTCVFEGTVSSHRVVATWDGRDSKGRALRSGLYFVVMTGPDGHSAVRKLVLGN